jgi:hypothetical protein
VLTLLSLQDHMYGNPIVDLKWHTGPGGERRVISSDTRIVKIWCGAWGAAAGRLHRSTVVRVMMMPVRCCFLPTAGTQTTARRSPPSSRRRTSTTCASGLATVRHSTLVTFHWAHCSTCSRHPRTTGLILVATESKRMAPFFVPSLGPAPRCVITRVCAHAELDAEGTPLVAPQVVRVP